MPPALFQPFGQRLLALPPRLLLLFIVWTLVWKGLALWRAARAGQSIWFIVMLLLNTGGLLEIVYLAFLAPRGPGSTGYAAGVPAPPQAVGTKAGDGSG